MRGNLTLKRKPGQSFEMTIDKAGLLIVVTLVEIDKNQVKLSIEAPQAVRIMRTEIKEK